ncbi:uncharacterized protein LOC114759270 [Neltuma alba]|uniref:uncharacterized protein LOC114759270 n=1 Tax=Neltuma alba TaxID=207710 RepID=UPI0010A2F6B0|nr:uncharacterized protein LOC114759270 [Prosopis alba]
MGVGSCKRGRKCATETEHQVGRFFLHEHTENESWETVVFKLLLSKQTHPPNFKLLTILFSPSTQPSPDMAWFQSLLTPLKRLWDRLHSTRRKGTGIYILYKDVKSCPAKMFMFFGPS